MKRASLLLLLLSACGRSSSAPRTTAEPPPTIAHDDLACLGAAARSGQTTARRYLLLARLDRKPIDSFARLSAEQRARLDALQTQPDLRLPLHLSGSRLAITIPGSHPLGPAELLIADEVDLAVLHFADRSLRMQVARDALADLLDCSTRVALRAGHELELAPVPAEELRPGELPRQGTKQRAVVAQIRFRYYPSPDRPRSWPIRLGVRFYVRDEVVPPAGELPGPGLLAALPLLEGSGLPLLATITEQIGRPLRFSVETVNESKPAGSSPWIEFRVEDQGWVRVPQTTFCLHRPGYREMRATRSTRPGLQLVTPSQLAGLRTARATGPLEVRNRSAHAALVYLDGAVLGFVAAGAQMTFLGIPEGYYRIYARSPTGLRAFGPFDSYVPGPLTLR